MLCLYAHCLSGCHTYSPGVQPSELARTACVCQDSGTATCLGRVARCVQEQTQRSARKSDRQVLSHWFARRQSLRHKHKASLVSSVKRRDEEGNLGRRHFMACTASLTVLWTSGFGFASLSFHIFFSHPWVPRRYLCWARDNRTKYRCMLGASLSIDHWHSSSAPGINISGTIHGGPASCRKRASAIGSLTRGDPRNTFSDSDADRLHNGADVFLPAHLSEGYRRGSAAGRVAARVPRLGG